MSQATREIYIPPYSGVRLIECRDHFQLVPVPEVRTVYGYGKIKSSRATIDPNDPNSEPIWDNLAPDEEVWAVMQWCEFGDGHQARRPSASRWQCLPVARILSGPQAASC
ncbi:MAG TPA: hypothetical protein VGO67_24515 [Verrucomicrobiae bacterium]